MRPPLRTAWLFLLLTFTHSAWGQAPKLSDQLAQIEKVVDDRRQELHIAGASLAIVKDGKVILLKGMGLRDVEANLPVTPDTQFAIGSSSKAFTAMTVMMTAEQGKLKLTDSPKKYLPYFHLKDPDADQKVTISDLLCHRVGLQRTDMAWYTGRLTSREAILVAGECEPEAKYGEAFQYQNVMFLTAGEVVAAAQKVPWRGYLEQKLLRPLGMKTANTSFRAMSATGDWAKGYAYDAEAEKFIRIPFRDIVAIAPAGAINASAREMARWAMLMCGGGELDGKRYVTPAGFEQLISPHMTVGGPVKYGYGWFLREVRGVKVVEHGGNIDGYNAQVAFLPEKHIGLVLLTNISGSPLGPFAIEKVIENLVPDAKPAPKVDSTASSGSTPAREPKSEAGKYTMKEAPVSFDVLFEEGKLFLSVPGQPKYQLIPQNGRTYKLGSPAPDGFRITFRDSKEDPKQTEMFLVQPQGNVVAVRSAPSQYKSPITVDDLSKRVIAAFGGEAAYSAKKTARVDYKVSYPREGLIGAGVKYRSAPNLAADEETITAAGKKIAFVRTAFDGSDLEINIGFLPSPKITDEMKAASRAESDFYSLVNWKKLFKTVEITGLEKVNGEECYAVTMTPEKGQPIVMHISTKTFLIVQRSAGGARATYKDYKDVAGIQVPFTVEETGGPFGKSIQKVTSAAFDVRIPASKYRVLKPKPAPVEPEIPEEPWP